jgi:NAD(P)-dependent dehydrogenase (short-subunit alcohol dehydrogenase family)
MPTVLITGANRGLGLGLARTYLEDGWRVVTASRRSSGELDALARNERLQCEILDLTDDGQLERLAAERAGQPLDVLINNAGMMAKSEPGQRNVQGFGHFDRKLWRRLFDINLFTPMKLAELFAPQLAASGRGRVVNLSSMLGSMELNDRGGLYAYRASKAAVNAITKSMALDLADRGITAIALHPGWVRTDMGGKGADLDIETSIRGMRGVIDKLTADDSGKFLSWDGGEMPW